MSKQDEERFDRAYPDHGLVCERRLDQQYNAMIKANNLAIEYQNRLAECERMVKRQLQRIEEQEKVERDILLDRQNLERKLAAAREAALTLMRSCQCEGTGGVPFPDSLGGGQVACPGHEQSLCLAREGSKILAALTEAGEQVGDKCPDCGRGLDANDECPWIAGEAGEQEKNAI